MRMTRAIALPAIAVLSLATATVASAATGPVTSTPPNTFGPSWDSPRTAEQPVATPATSKCSVNVLQHGFADYNVLATPYAAPTCAKNYAKAVLHLDGAVNGRQFDRLGWLDINGVRVLTTSTPEPSASGITWHVERDVTDVLPALLKDGASAMYLGNTVDSTYTGVLDVKVTIDFYAAHGSVKPAAVANQILSLADTRRDNGDLVGTVTAPTSTERVTAQVYATGSGGGCEEFWDTSAPSATGYSCGDGLPYRQVDVLIDGQVAGVALPVAYIYTGGWSNPFMWYNIPSPGAFNIAPLDYDLTPFVAVLHNGKPHEVRVRVAGGPSDGSGWTLNANLHVWTDARGRTLPAKLVSSSTAPATIDSTATGASGQAGSVQLSAKAVFTATGWVDTAAGRITTTVNRTLGNTSTHSWTAGEERDDLDASWSDTQTVKTTGGHARPSIRHTALTWSKTGVLTFDPDAANPTVATIGGSLDLAFGRIDSGSVAGVTMPATVTSNRFVGQADWLYGVPREERIAHAKTAQTYGVRTGRASYTHQLEAVNGYFTVDSESIR